MEINCNEEEFREDQKYCLYSSIDITVMRCYSLIGARNVMHFCAVMSCSVRRIVVQC